MRYRYLAAVFVLVYLFTLSICMQSVSASTGHGCAPPVPPGIPGSPAPAPAAPDVVVINEVLLNPHSTWNCSESGVYSTMTDTWIELYNTQNQPYDLYTAHAVIDSGPNTNAYYFPFDASIAAHGYLVVFPRLTTSFLSTETPLLRLVIQGVVIDQVIVPTLGPDQSYARTSDGASSWIVTSAPTIDASNTSLSTPTTSTGATGPGTLPTGATAQAMVSGTQPIWQKLSMPMATPQPAGNTSSTSTSSPAPTSPITPTNGGLDTTRRIILTLLVMALGATLFWGWRVYRR